MEAGTNVLSDGRSVLIGQAKQEGIAGKGGIEGNAEAHRKVNAVGKQKKGGGQPDPRCGVLPRGGEGDAGGVVWREQSDFRSRGWDPERVRDQVLSRNVVWVGWDADRKARPEAMIKLIDGVPRRAPGVQQGRGRTETSVAEERRDKGIKLARGPEMADRLRRAIEGQAQGI